MYPGFEITGFTFIGAMEVTFSQKLQPVRTLSEINDDVFEINLIPDETNEIEDIQNLKFTWHVTEFTDKTMNIQIDFREPPYISAGLKRDKIIATVKNYSYFFSEETLLNIPVETFKEVQVPKSMPNTEFTIAFADFNEGMGNFSSAALVGNFISNLLLSGTMSLIWGLLHSMQIIAHFPLLNIMMPTNAHMLFKILIKIATLDLLPTEEFLEDVQEFAGLINDDYELTDDFVTFGFDSTGPIRNMQVMFIGLVSLVLIPLLLLAIKLIFLWSSCCTRFIDRLLKRLFFNSYIRFWLEAYLELSLSSFIRFKSFNFDNGSEIFHSIFSSVLLLLLLASLTFSLIFLQVRYPTLAYEKTKEKFGDLYLGLKTSSRCSLLTPFLFMLRRTLYAAILVYWVERPYFQIQFMILHSSLVMIYVGYFRPFESNFSSNLELMNETLTLMCTYSLVMFSAFVPDPATRYECGW